MSIPHVSHSYGEYSEHSNYYIDGNDVYLAEDEYLPCIEEGLEYLGDDEDDGTYRVNENVNADFHETQVEDNFLVDEQQSLLHCVIDEDNKYTADDEQSLGSDSVHSDYFIDSECELSNEKVEFYRNVRVETNLGGLYNTTFIPTPILPSGHQDNHLKASHNHAGFPVFNSKNDMDDPQFSCGMIFEGAIIFRDAIRSHSIKHARELKFKRNDSDRIEVNCCAEGCPWSIYAASFRQQKGHTLQVKKFNGYHSCGREDKVKAANLRWIAKKYEVEIITNEKWPISSMKKVLSKNDHLQFSKDQLYRAKRKAREMAYGNEDEQYSWLWSYAAEIMRSDASNTVKIKPFERDDGKTVFKRIYICWGAMKKGFDAGLRKFICLDGCHLKTKNGGILLIALGIDPNNSLYPIAYAIVEKEKTETWKWFLEYLQIDLVIPGETEQFTFISDKQKGLIVAIEQLFPNCEHRFCVLHLYNNFKQSHSGLALKLLLWEAAKCTRVVDFENVMKKIRSKDLKAYTWLAKKPAAGWSRSYFRDKVKTDICVNNFSESYNKLILEARKKPIIEMLEELRVSMMKRLWVNRDKMLNWKGNLCPNVVIKLELHKYKSNDFDFNFNGNGQFEIMTLGGGQEKWAVDLENKTCSCRKWQLSGVPCAHVLRALKFLGRVPEDFVDPCYLKSTYASVYSHFMPVLKGREEWPHSDKPKLLPPVIEKLPGRPKKCNRKKSSLEIQEIKARKALERVAEAGKIGRHGQIMTCRYCKMAGHNIRGCFKRKKDEALETSNQTQNGVTRKNNVVLNTQGAIAEALNNLKIMRTKNVGLNTQSTTSEIVNNTKDDTSINISTRNAQDINSALTTSNHAKKKLSIRMKGVEKKIVEPTM